MRLENLYPNFGKATPEDQAAYISAYRLRRAKDMAKPSTWPKAKKKSSGSKSIIDLSPAEKLLMKSLGLKQKDMLMLKALAETEDDSDEIEEEEEDDTE